MAQLETPVEVMRRLTEQARQESLAAASKRADRFTRARTPYERGAAIGQNFGEAAIKAFMDVKDPDNIEDRPEYQQALQRRIWLNVEPDDTATMKKNIVAAMDAGDYEAAQYITDLYYKARTLELQQQKQDIDAQPAPEKPKKWKDWPKDFRDRSIAQLSELPWVTDLNDDEEQAKVTDALIARAESQWNQLREAGHDVPRERVLRIVAQDASQYLNKKWYDDSFDFNSFHNNPSALERFLIEPEKQAQQDTSTTAKEKRPPVVGEERGGYYFKGGDPSNPASWSKEPITQEEEKTTRRGRRTNTNR